MDVDVEEAPDILGRENIEMVHVREEIIPEEVFQERNWVVDEEEEEEEDVRSSRERGDFSITDPSEAVEDGSGGDVLESFGKIEQAVGDEEDVGGSGRTYYPVTVPMEDVQQGTNNDILEVEDVEEEMEEEDVDLQKPTTIMPVALTILKEESSQESNTEHKAVPPEIHEEESVQIIFNQGLEEAVVESKEEEKGASGKHSLEENLNQFQEVTANEILLQELPKKKLEKEIQSEAVEAFSLEQDEREKLTVDIDNNEGIQSVLEESIKQLEDKLQESENRLEDEIEKLEERAKEVSVFGSVELELPTEKLQKKQEVKKLRNPKVAVTKVMEVNEETFQEVEKSMSCQKSNSSSASTREEPEEQLSREEKAARRRVALRRRKPISRASLVQTRRRMRSREPKRVESHEEKEEEEVNQTENTKIPLQETKRVFQLPSSTRILRARLGRKEADERLAKVNRARMRNPLRSLQRRKKNIKSDDVGAQYVHGKSFLEERRRRVRGRIPISKRLEVKPEKGQGNKGKTSGSKTGVVRTHVKYEKGSAANAAEHHPSSDEVLMSAILSDDKASEPAVGTFSDGSDFEEVDEEEEVDVDVGVGKEEEVGVGNSASAEATEVGAVAAIGGEKAGGGTQASGETAQAEYSTTALTYGSTQDGFDKMGNSETTGSELSETEEIAADLNEAASTEKSDTKGKELTTEEDESTTVESIEEESERLNPVPANSRAAVMPVFISEEVVRPYQRHFQRPYQAISEEVVEPTLMSTIFLPGNHHFMLR